MIYNVINGAAVMAASILGLLMRKGLKERYVTLLMQALGLCVMYIGMRMFDKGENAMTVLFSIVIGGLIGEFLQIENRMEALGVFLEKRMNLSDFNRGFLPASLFFCTGSMAIIGAFEAGLSGNGETLLAKSVLDGLTALIYAGSLGPGVFFSAFSVMIYQGFFILLAGILRPFFTQSALVLISAVGGVLIFALGLNMTVKTQIRVGNFIPALFLPLLLGLNLF